MALTGVKGLNNFYVKELNNLYTVSLASCGVAIEWRRRIKLSYLPNRMVAYADGANFHFALMTSLAMATATSGKHYIADIASCAATVSQTRMTSCFISCCKCWPPLPPPPPSVFPCSSFRFPFLLRPSSTAPPPWLKWWRNRSHHCPRRLIRELTQR